LETRQGARAGGSGQHAYAEPQHDLAYKPETPPSDEIRRELAWVAASSWGADQALERVRVELGEEADAESADPEDKRRRRPEQPSAQVGQPLT
jgi:ppGpp synthetase/RelA/SpoT-type nucleotidyltranferase